MVRRYSLVLALALVFMCSLTPVSTHAVSIAGPIVPSDCTGAGGCQTICDLATLANNLLNAGIFVAVFLSAILFAWAGWKYVTAGGESGKVSDAKKIFLNVTLGLVLILSAWIIVQVILQTLTGKTTWFQLCNQSLSVPPPLA